MSLYGYDLAQYVVETSLGVPTGGADCTHENCYNSRAHGYEWHGPSHD
jgi:hypothetical protein